MEMVTHPLNYITNKFFFLNSFKLSYGSAFFSHKTKHFKVRIELSLQVVSPMGKINNTLCC